MVRSIAKCSSRAILFFNLLLRRRGGETGSRQSESDRFAGRRAWMAPAGVSAAGIIARAREPGLIAIGVFGLDDGRQNGCRLKRLCCHEIDQASRSRYCERLMKIRPINGLRRYGIDAKHRFLGRRRLGRGGSRPWITAAASRTIWEPLGYGAKSCAASRCIASNRTPCRVALGTSSATVTQCLRSL